ncbi:sphingosine kinase [Trifolium repens]|nr:sphingosine kinase [Trifolium repens]
MDSERRTMVPPKQNYQTLLFVEGVPLLLKVKAFNFDCGLRSKYLEKEWIIDLNGEVLIRRKGTYKYEKKYLM